MKRSLKYITLALLTTLMVAHVAVASFTGHSTGKKNKYSLKTLNKAPKKAYSLSSLKTGTFYFKGTQQMKLSKLPEAKTQVNSLVRYENGNTTFVFPYKYTVKAPGKFVTPKAPQQ